MLSSSEAARARKGKVVVFPPGKRIRVKMLPAGDPLKAVRLGCDARREAIRIPGSRGVKMHE